MERKETIDFGDQGDFVSVAEKVKAHNPNIPEMAKREDAGYTRTFDFETDPTVQIWLDLWYNVVAYLLPDSIIVKKWLFLSYLFVLGKTGLPDCVYILNSHNNAATLFPLSLLGKTMPRDHKRYYCAASLSKQYGGNGILGLFSPIAEPTSDARDVS